MEYSTASKNDIGEQLLMTESLWLMGLWWFLFLNFFNIVLKFYLGNLKKRSNNNYS